MILICLSLVTNGFPGGTVVKNPTTTARDLRDTGSRSGRSPGVGNGIPLQHSCLGNPMDRGAWWVTVQESDMTEQLTFYE